MSKTLVVRYSILLIIGLALLGWLAYPLLIDLIRPAAGGGPIATSMRELLFHRVSSALPLCLLGLELGLGSWIAAGPSSSRANYLSCLLFLFSAGLAGSIAWAWILSRSVARLYGNGLPAAVSMDLSNIPLYQIGLSGCFSVVVLVLLLTVRRKLRAKGQTP